jgi:methylated-DNA-[protein]-cysteine S-methyltransferase
MTLEFADFESPIGRLTAAVYHQRLCALSFPERWPVERVRLEKRFRGVELRGASDPAGVVSRLREYFAGALDALAEIPVDPGGTVFQQSVWSALRRIPPGRTVAYRDLAHSIGVPAAVRAVGAANGANPIAIVIPCHRAIGADGSLTGYAGGLERKRWLLSHEGNQLRLECASLRRGEDKARHGDIAM